jgi:hypothetical protein
MVNIDRLGRRHGLFGESPLDRLASLARETTAKHGAEMRPDGSAGEVRRPGATKGSGELPRRGPGV